MDLDIVMLQCGFPELTVRAIQSIKATSMARIILVDNGSDAADVKTALDELRSWDTLIRNHENLGFAKAVNQGIRASTAPYVCVQNNDTVVHRDALQNMLDWLEADKTLGLIGPLTNSANTEQRVSGPEAMTGGYRYTSGLVAFFCAVIPRRVIDDVGPLSEEYGLGYGEDDDYCIRLRRAGYLLGIAHDAYVHHDHHTTYRALFGDDGIREMGEQGLALLREKYGQTA